MSKALENMAQEELLQAAKELEVKNRHLKSETQYLQFRLDQLNRLLFCAKRERFVSNEINGQMSLPFEVEKKPAAVFIDVCLQMFYLVMHSSEPALETHNGPV